eukprot:CAMPEP_0172207230 /NCGR_PEP_ID=MMETSP1050-20130122/33711_1 /TAXON_ID=233186 /ORGANISM="Cryptomonas curvata, Strain CCAP979/52" /LENGTH=127 /DNA_ID=CAMNT_0012886507 /DNA_START=1 /DNA_END=381 /DNA_ORIENTATION=+
MDVVTAGRRPAWPTILTDLTALARYRDIVDRCWHQDPAERPPFAELAHTLESMAYEFPAEEPQRQVSTGGRLFQELSAHDCRLNDSLIASLAWTKHGNGTRLYNVDLPRTSPLSDAEQELCDEVRAH